MILPFRNIFLPVPLIDTLGRMVPVLIGTFFGLATAGLPMASRTPSQPKSAACLKNVRRLPESSIFILQSSFFFWEWGICAPAQVFALDFQKATAE